MFYSSITNEKQCARSSEDTEKNSATPHEGKTYNAYISVLPFLCADILTQEISVSYLEMNQNA